MWFLPYFFCEALIEMPMDLEETLGGAFALVLFDFTLLNRGIKKCSFKNLVGILITIVLVLYAILYPSLIFLTPWILGIGASYCSVLTRYENPCFLDYLSWVGLFGFFIVLEFMRINCYLAIGYEVSFLEGFFGGWIGLMALQWKSVLGSLSLMVLTILLDFLFIKSNISSAISRLSSRKPQIQTNREIAKKMAEHRPGIAYFRQSNTIHLKSPLLSRAYSIDSYTSKHLIHNFVSSLTPKKGFNRKNEKNSKTLIIERVLYKGKMQNDFVGLLSKHSMSGLQLKIVSLRTKCMVFKSHCDSYGKDIFDGSLFYGTNPNFIQIREDRRMLLFFDGDLTPKALLLRSNLFNTGIYGQIFCIFDMKSARFIQFVRKVNWFV